MSRVRMIALVACISLVLTSCCPQLAQARPGPPSFASSPERWWLNGVPKFHAAQLKSGTSRIVRHSEAFVFEGKCTETGSCEEKRFLTDQIDYKNDGPNNPITDPPH